MHGPEIKAARFVIIVVRKCDRDTSALVCRLKNSPEGICGYLPGWVFLGRMGRATESGILVGLGSGRMMLVPLFALECNWMVASEFRIHLCTIERIEMS